MEHHDVVVECAKLSVDSKDEAVTPCYSAFRPRSESELKRSQGKFTFSKTF